MLLDFRLLILLLDSSTELSKPRGSVSKDSAQKLHYVAKETAVKNKGYRVLSETKKSLRVIMSLILAPSPQSIWLENMWKVQLERLECQLCGRPPTTASTKCLLGVRESKAILFETRYFIFKFQ